jgi:hypothetical protein
MGQIRPSAAVSSSSETNAAGQSCNGGDWCRKEMGKRSQWEVDLLKRRLCMGWRKGVRPQQASRSDVRHNTSVRQMTMQATSSPNKLPPRASPADDAPGQPARGPRALWGVRRHDSRTRQREKRRSKLTSMTGRPIFLRPLRGELGALLNCMCSASETALGVDEACLVSAITGTQTPPFVMRWSLAPGGEV